MSLFNYECDEVKQMIDEVSPNYPQLTTFEKEWIFFHKYHYIPGIPVELECQEVSVNPTGTVQNAIPYPYKSAVLKGNTLVANYNSGIVELTANGAWVENHVKLTQLTLPVKPSTDYLFVVEMIENSLIGDETINNSLRFGETDGVGVQPSAFTKQAVMPLHQLGMYRFILTTKANINDIEIFDRKQLSKHCTSGKIKFRYMVIEYQQGMENWDIPYFTGMQSVKMPVLKTVGKNLFDGEWEQGGIDQTTGALFDSTSHRCKNKIPVVPLSQIVSNANLNLLFYDENDLFVGYKYQGQGYTMQVPEGAVYMRFYRGAKLDDLQIEENTVATTYEPYKSNILTVNEDITLCGIGDVKDELNLLTGDLTQKITEERLSNKGWELDKSNTNSKNIGFYMTHSNSKANGAILSEQYPTLTGEQWKNKSLCGIYKGSSSLGFVIARSSLTEETATGFMKWLSKNPITIKYELATPVAKIVALSKLPKPYEGTNNYHLTANIPCETILEVPVVSTGEQTLQEINNY